MDPVSTKARQVVPSRSQFILSPIGRTAAAQVGVKRRGLKAGLHAPVLHIGSTPQSAMLPSEAPALVTEELPP